jgi:hypothetical protein
MMSNFEDKLSFLIEAVIVAERTGIEKFYKDRDQLLAEILKEFGPDSEVVLSIAKIARLMPDDLELLHEGHIGTSSATSWWSPVKLIGVTSDLVIVESCSWNGVYSRTTVDAGAVGRVLRLPAQTSDDPVVSDTRSQGNE